MLSVDVKEYEKLLRVVAGLSPLFSDSETPFLNSRFIEKLYVHAANARDLSRRDMTFDAVSPTGYGVGVKTFIASSFDSSKSEKVAEFTSYAAQGEFLDLSHIDLARKVSIFRNARIESDARIYDIDLQNSIYHCLVRAPNSLLVHEEAFEVVDIEAIELLPESRKSSGHVHFTDSKNQYSFNVSKNTLYKRFILSSGENSNIIELVEEPVGVGNSIEGEFVSRILKLGMNNKSANLNDTSLNSNVNSVVLPLYSSRLREIPERSGINQWNAKGRDRKFGEAYIPVPSKVRNSFPSFFPEKDSYFRLRLPNEQILNVKICQQGGKALMSNPNKDLCDWLFRLIDNSEWTSRKRIIEHRPYKYSDLVHIGIDSVRISKTSEDTSLYELEPCELGSYEFFSKNL